MDKIPKNSTPQATSPEELTTLYEVAMAVGATLDLRQALYDVLDILSRRMDMRHGTVTLLSPGQDVVQVEVAHGMSVNAVRRGRYKMGEGITGRVVETGDPIIVPHISQEPLFLDRTRIRRQNPAEDISFLCVPIKSGTKVIGTISVDRVFQNEPALKADLRFLTIIATLIARTAVNLETLNREKDQLHRENERLTQALADKFATTNIVGNSNKMKEVFHLIEQVSGSTATVLIRGESGTGKELVASAIHYNSPRAKGPFITVNCSALPASLIESELFGHIRGAFTGAVRDKPGRFERANKGTIFLDEIGSIPVETQAKLLRVLQEREIERVGDIRTRAVDVRIIAATNRDLEQAMEQGEFREDLYWRLNVFPIFLPPLRERPTDTLLLADHFVERYAQRHQKDVRRISTPAIDALTIYHWPGNVRELENCIERAVLLSNEGVIHAYHLPPSLQTAEDSQTGISTSLDDALAKVERDLISDALKSSHGNMAQAARILQSTERIIRYKVKKYDLNPRRFR
ncbi:MAG: sigma 54-interacting transcriptional regulator [Deltaproteobacteria bacterium]|nr:sigma 54-interacting transcriptional regulator [Deltaproteobacteria bacterium]MBW2051190.1 sigma 54-interacting transcriptional regulator [Deltaproteobacteria bacterium]MBW2139831.1 sigma 54-interacting transcriptional regulator [Deltaproteobacteria bacterium]MBW2321996.1 sigma 54-interacting transcriptional regulator [Deltaproteobacteria bacterium]